MYFGSTKNCYRVLLFFSALFILSQAPLLGNQLLYQPTGAGKLTGFDIELLPTVMMRPANYWHNKDPILGEAWQVRSSAFYVGRVLFLGEPGTPMTITNLGPLPSSGSGYSLNKFYWTQMTGGGNDWTEYYIVLRPKGFTHEEKQDDYFKKHIAIQETGGSIILERGAGPSTELVVVGEQGFDGKGKAGTYNGSNEFKYKYQYKAIFIDVTLIPPNNSHWTRKVIGISYPQYGFYESNIKFSVPGDSLSLSLQGEHGKDNELPSNPSCMFEVTNYCSDTVPYEILRNHHFSVATALEIGSLSYSSPSCEAVVTLASNVAGTEANFAFKSETSNATIPHRLVYHCTTGREGDCDNPIVVTNNRKSFLTYHDPIGPPSPIEGTLGPGNYLEAKLKIYLDPTSHYPTSGEYTSTIYVLLERY